MSLYLVSCVSQKLPVSAPAKDLYTSPLFCKARSYVERKGQPWFILSAKHGLLHPDQPVAPYDLTLNTMGYEIAAGGRKESCHRWSHTWMMSGASSS